MLSQQIDWQAREADSLAPYAVHSAQSRGRRFPEPEDPWRTPFQRDRDRLIHSTSFRKLAYKTQVFVNYADDYYYRTRLTHTLEATQITRTVARALRLNEDLAEAISLIHDLGHPPFAHYGEEALHTAMEPYEGFDHNSQTLRIVDVLEHHDYRYPGLNLTWEVREGSAKHQTTWRTRSVAEFAEAGPHPSLEAQIADLSDDIAYTCHDLDDGIRSGYLSFDQLQQAGLWLWNEAVAAVDAAAPGVDALTRRKMIVRWLINWLVTDFITATGAYLAAADFRDADAIRQAAEPVARLSADGWAGLLALKAFLHRELYRHYQVMRLGEAGKQIVHALFEEFMRRPEKLPPTAQAQLNRDSLSLTVCDYVAGLTDRAALAEHERLFRVPAAWLP